LILSVSTGQGTLLVCVYMSVCHKSEIYQNDEALKRRIMQSTPFDISDTLVF